MLPLIGCPPKLLSIVKSFHDGMRSTVQFDGDFSNDFEVKSGVKQGCVLAPILFGIFFSLLLKHAFKSSTDGIYLHSRSDGHLFDVARLRARQKACTTTQQSTVFASQFCSSRCSFRFGLFSHSKCYSSSQPQYTIP